MDDLTPRQAEILQLIADFVQSTGFPPTRAEIARSLGFRSANAAEDHLKALEKKGFIELFAGASRGIRLRRDSACRSSAGSPQAARSSPKPMSRGAIRSTRCCSTRVRITC